MFYFLRELTCKHEFELIKNVKYYSEDYHYSKKELPVGSTMIFMCKKCGKIKKIKS